jgi:hypothetical protein
MLLKAATHVRQAFAAYPQHHTADNDALPYEVHV